jgi:hypothetical protein
MNQIAPWLHLTYLGVATPSRTDLLAGTLDVLILKGVSLGPLHVYAVLLRIEQITGGALLYYRLTTVGRRQLQA